MKMNHSQDRKNKPKTNPIKANPELAEGAIEKFLSLCPESATIIRKVRSPEMATFRNSVKKNSGAQPGWVRSKFGDKLPCQRNSLRKR